MFTRTRFITLFCLLALLLAACGPTATTDNSPMDETGSDTMMDDETMMDDDMMDDEAMMDDDMMDDNMMDDETMMDDDMMDDEAMMDDDMMDDEAMMDDDMMDDEAMMDDDMMDDEAMMDDDMMDDEAMMDLPDWFTMPLTDIHSGESFTIQELQGQVILVETMAIWCSNCLQQQRQVKSLHDALGNRDDFVSLALNIDPNEDADALQAYTDRHDFDWLYAVAPVEMSRDISQLYGNQFLNPPSVPMFIIDRQGEVHLLPFGIKNAQSLQEALQPFLDM